MLENGNVMGFIPTVKPDMARAFYSKILDLKLESEDEFAIVFKSNLTSIRVVKVPNFTPFPFTILGWHLKDSMEDTVQRLSERGVVFVRYDWFTQDSLGIWEAPGGTKVAWFKDPDGNLLSLSS